MANVKVANKLTSRRAARRSRYEKAEVAYGKILAADYADGDILEFDFIPSKEIIHGKFVASDGTALEIFYGANFAAPVAFPVSSALDISYKVEYIRGTGMVKDGVATAGEGDRLRLQT